MSALEELEKVINEYLLKTYGYTVAIRRKEETEEKEKAVNDNIKL